MRTFNTRALFSLSLLLASALGVTVGCGGDDDDSPSGSSGSKNAGGEGGSGTSGSTNKGGSKSDGGSTSNGGKNAGGAPEAGSTSMAGEAGMGGAAPSACDLSGAGLEHETIPNPTGTMTLTSDKIWDLSDVTYTEAGDTLTIEPCTRIEGAKDPIGVLVIERGAKIMAEGTADAPILFTSPAAPGEREVGDWGGVVLLGKAPNFQGDMVNAEGLEADPKNQYGGNVPTDNSGVMTYVGIMYAGFTLTSGSEVNGLTFYSVGSKTKIENIFVGQAADDCYEWFGGTVNVSNIICQNNDDDMFDTDFGWAGTITNAFGRHTIAPTESSNGIETGYDQATPITPTGNLTGKYQNVTVCGYGETVTKTGYGILSRAYVESHVDEAVGVGFDFGFNQEFPKDGDGITLSNVDFFGMFGDANQQVVNPADNDTAAGDNAFDEQAVFDAGTGDATEDLGFTADDCNKAGGPAASVMASKRGAFKASQTWMNWVPADWWTDK